MSIIQRAAVAGLTGVIGLGLGLTLGVAGANAAAHHGPDKGSSNSATQHGQQKQGMQKKLDERQSATKGHNKGELKAGPNEQQDKAQQDKSAKIKDAQPREPKSGGITPPSDTPDAVPAPTQ